MMHIKPNGLPAIGWAVYIGVGVIQQLLIIYGPVLTELAKY